MDKIILIVTVEGLRREYIGDSIHGHPGFNGIPLLIINGLHGRVILIVEVVAFLMIGPLTNRARIFLRSGFQLPGVFLKAFFHIRCHFPVELQRAFIQCLFGDSVQSQQGLRIGIGRIPIQQRLQLTSGQLSVPGQRGFAFIKLRVLPENGVGCPPHLLLGQEMGNDLHNRIAAPRFLSGQVHPYIYSSVVAGKFLQIRNLRIGNSFFRRDRHGSGVRRLGFRRSIFFTLLRIHRTGCQNRDTHKDTNRADPGLRLFPSGHIPNTAFGVPLSEGKGCSGDDLTACGQPQQGSGIVRPDMVPQLSDHRFIAAHLHVLPRQKEGCPHQRVKPVDTQRGVGQQLDDMVAPADMVPFVGDDEPPLLHGNRGWQVNPGTENPHSKGRGDVVRQVNLTTVQHRAHQSPAQTEIVHTAGNHHDPNSRQPDPGGDGDGSNNSPCRHCVRPDRLLGRVIGLEKQLPLSIDILHRQIGHGTGCPGSLGDLGLCHLQQGHGRRQ